jgi:pyruvate kinase
MIDHARAAEQATGHRLRVFIDLAGPKIRTAKARKPKHRKRLTKGSLLAVVPVGGLKHSAIPHDAFAVECTLREAIAAAKPGEPLFYNDGELAAKIERAEPWGLLSQVIRCPADGSKLKPEKGLNFPETDLDVPALTAADRAILPFVAKNADGIGFSFVQSADDVVALQAALADERADWATLTLILKIETPRALANLPEILVQAASHQPTAIMIARGDLAVEIGFARLAEMQEELLWLAEAAQLPAIWATQVLENLIKTGAPTRGEMTDAAMAARAECVMLNKGPHLLEAIDLLDTLLARMDSNQHKKTPQLRALKSW